MGMSGLRTEVKNGSCPASFPAASASVAHTASIIWTVVASVEHPSANITDAVTHVFFLRPKFRTAQSALTASSYWATITHVKDATGHNVQIRTASQTYTPAICAAGTYVVGAARAIAIRPSVS